MISSIKQIIYSTETKQKMIIFIYQLGLCLHKFLPSLSLLFFLFLCFSFMRFFFLLHSDCFFLRKKKRINLWFCCVLVLFLSLSLSLSSSSSKWWVNKNRIYFLNFFRIKANLKLIQKIKKIKFINNIIYKLKFFFIF